MLMHTMIESPLGDLTAVASSGEMVGLYFHHHWYMPASSTLGVRAWLGTENDTGFDELRRQLGEYFDGERREFGIPLRASGNDLQRRVWGLLRQVPYGETSTYGQLARELADGTTPQDVGAAVGRNPLSILVPCHRIVGSTGKLTGYAGGLRRKQFLLDLERSRAEHPTRLF
ncbi:MAG TPA: methylated-DNA--[protein]-cysteine S-methyltransferase [Acidimicrobiales bacterium]|nr:methylated-DNA--[protein]-cysteine S-methyltransferase [Acidimicrobiales bacterium]